MSTDSYVEARVEASETMRLYAGVNEVNHRLLEHLGRREHEVVSAESAVAVRLVALLTKGIEVPTHPFLPIVLAPNGRRIHVFAALHERRGLYGGPVASQSAEFWDEVAFVFFQDGKPQVVHIIDREHLPLVSEMLGADGMRRPHGFDSSDCTLNTLLHCNVMLEPLTAEVLGIRTFVFDDSPDVGWRRVESV